MRKRLSFSSLILIAFVSSSAVASAQTADEVIEKHLAAMGGREALSKLTSRRVVGTISVGTPSGNITGPIEIDSKAPNKARAYFELDLTSLGAGKMTVERKFDGLKGRGGDQQRLRIGVANVFGSTDQDPAGNKTRILS